MEPFVQTICAAKKYVVSSTLEKVDWKQNPCAEIWARPFNNSNGSRARDCPGRNAAPTGVDGAGTDR